LEEKNPGLSSAAQRACSAVYHLMIIMGYIGIDKKTNLKKIKWFNFCAASCCVAVDSNSSRPLLNKQTNKQTKERKENW
jgi:hypothetical protein